MEINDKMKQGIITLGEALIDFIPLNNENTVYQKSPGGAPANVAVGLARLGADVHFLGKVGEDSLGYFLKDTLESYHVETSAMALTQKAKTSIVLVTNDEKGERSFEFFIQPGADSFLAKDDIDNRLFKSKNILHIGSISLIEEPVQSATWHAIHLAKENGLRLSYDPNLRLSLWENEQVAKETIEQVLPYTDILKLSDEELIFLKGEDSEQAVEQLATDYNIPLVFVTRGEHGSLCYCRQGFSWVPAMEVEAIDTTGAGDAFVSAILYQVDQLDQPLQHLTREDVKYMAQFASVSGGLAASTKGAMSALPELKDIELTLINRNIREY